MDEKLLFPKCSFSYPELRKAIKVGGWRCQRVPRCPQVESRTPIVSEVILESRSWRSCNSGAPKTASNSEAESGWISVPDAAGENILLHGLTNTVEWPYFRLFQAQIIIFALFFGIPGVFLTLGMFWCIDEEYFLFDAVASKIHLVEVPSNFAWKELLNNFRRI